MNAILIVALPFFALIFTGYAAIRWKLMGENAVQGLNGVVFYFALPSLLFVKVIEAPLESLFDPRFFVAYYLPTIGLMLVTTATVRWLMKRAVGEAAIRGLSTCWANSGYMGIPLLLTLGGDEAALAAVLVLTLDNLIISPMAIIAIESDRGSVKLARIALNLIKNPLIIAVFGGFAVALAGLTLPAPLMGYLDTLSAATVPCALFALGGSLVGVPVTEAKREIFLTSALKLLVHPLLVALFAYVIIPLEPTMALATVIVAALPAGASVFVLAQRYEVYVRRASSVVLFTHLASVLTVTALLVWAEGGL
ncbi:MAG: AEC family transporter [Geminicoccaceae bacterium]